MEPSQGDARLSAGSRVVTRACRVPDVSFRAFLTARSPPRVHWADLSGLELVGAGAATRLEAAGPDRFDAIREAAADLFATVDHEGPPETRPRLIGGFAFDEDHDPAPPWEGFPAGGFVLPRVQLTRGQEGTWLSVTACDEDPDAVEADLDAAREAVEDLPRMQPSAGTPGVRGTRIVPDRERWTELVEAAVDRIESDGLRKVVLATAMEVDLAESVDIPAVLERLRRTYPECFRFLVQPTEAASFFGPPPERLVAKDGRAVESEALAGSMPRGETPAEDDEYARSLLGDEKLQHEQGLVVDWIRDQLTAFGEVGVGEQGVRKLTNIQHLQTPIEATVDEDVHVLDLVEALHPTPAVGGVPRDIAVETILETEPFDRGWYTGPVGWFDAAGDGQFAVGIRSGVAGGESATLFAGNGIVADSDPDDEWEEIQPKYRPILDELE